MRVLIFGAGAVGSVLGARLTAAGRSVVLAARPEHARAITVHGLRVDGIGAGVFRLDVVGDVRDATGVDAVVVAVKTFDLARAAALIGSSLPPRPLLLVQNGLGIEDAFVAKLRASGWTQPERWVVRAVQSIPATWLGPGRVLAAGIGEVVLPSPGASPATSAAIEAFRAVFDGTAVPVRSTDDLAREVWKKALVNAAVNPITAVHRVLNGTLAAEPLRSEALRLLEEARQVAVRSGVAFPPGEAVAEFDRVVAATSANRSSMLQDLDRGRPTEIDAISGEILRLGEALGLTLPATHSVVLAVRQLAARGSDRPQLP